MRGEVITFDGHRMNDLFYVGQVSVGLPEFEPSYEDRSIGNGVMLKGTRMGTVSVSVRLVAKPRVGHDAREALSALVSWLDVDGAKRLSLSGDGGLWRLAVPEGAPSVEDARWNDIVTVRFLQVDPLLYGTERSVTVPSGGTAGIVTGGDAPTSPTISASGAVRASESGVWGVRLDEGDFLHVALPTASESAVSIDCGRRTCSVDGATTLPTLDSDWWEMRPGAHTIRNDVGTGACTLTWVERWHR